MLPLLKSDLFYVILMLLDFESYLLEKNYNDQLKQKN